MSAWPWPECRGGTEGINSAFFYVCPVCSACIIEMYPPQPDEPSNRQKHLAWHQADSPVEQP